MANLPSALRHPLRYLPLTLKVLAVTVAAGALVGLLLDRVLDSTLERLYENELLTELDNQSRTERLRFDHEIKEFRHTARVAAGYSGLHRFLAARPLGDGEVNHAVDLRPTWFPGRSMTAAAVHPRVAVVLDELRRVVATYRTQLPELPEALARPTSAPPWTPPSSLRSSGTRPTRPSRRWSPTSMGRRASWSAPTPSGSPPGPTWLH